MTFPMYGKMKHVPNHQPVIYVMTNRFLCRNNIDHKSSTAQLWKTNSMDICLQISFLRRLLDASSVHISASAERQARFGSSLSYKMESMLSSRIKYDLKTSKKHFAIKKTHFSLPCAFFISLNGTTYLGVSVIPWIQTSWMGLMTIHNLGNECEMKIVS